MPVQLAQVGEGRESGAAGEGGVGQAHGFKVWGVGGDGLDGVHGDVEAVAGDEIMGHFEGFEGREEGRVIFDELGENVQVPVVIEWHAQVFEVGSVSKEELEREEAVAGLAVGAPVVWHGGEGKLDNAIPDELALFEWNVLVSATGHDEPDMLAEVWSGNEGSSKEDYATDGRWACIGIALKDERQDSVSECFTGS